MLRVCITEVQPHRKYILNKPVTFCGSGCEEGGPLVALYMSKVE
jgi:hypothetical protein